LRVAIVHDWLVVNGGAEKVLKEILNIFPEADIFTLVDFLNPKDRRDILKGKSTTTTFIQKLPFAKNHFRNYLPLFPKAIESLDLRGYDLIISSSWAVAKGVRRNKRQLHICYCHTPIRYAWDLYDEYTNNLREPKKFLVKKTLQYIRKWDINSLDRVDYFIANSNFVRERILRIYKKDAVVINPPVDINRFRLNTKKENFYLTASRLVPYKKTKLIVEAFNQMPDRRLVVIGTGEEFELIEGIAKSNIKILGYVDDEVLVDYMQRAKAFVYGALEDFGIIPIEAMACGTPVIAFGKGGIRDSLIDGINGIFFEEQTIDDIIYSIDRFEKIYFDFKVVSSSVERFSVDRFKKEFENFIERSLIEKR
jgi:glycosyltransferase involved in cell wall biosynthesis